MSSLISAYTKSLLAVILFYLLIGPIVGSIAFWIYAGQGVIPNLLVIVGGFVLGIFPALIAGFINWIVLVFFFRLKSHNYYIPCIIFPFVGASIFSYYYGVNQLKPVIIICLAGSWVCAHFINSIAWDILNKSDHLPDKAN